jgi:hypothetical protein
LFRTTKRAFRMSDWSWVREGAVVMNSKSAAEIAGSGILWLGMFKLNWARRYCASGSSLRGCGLAVERVSYIDLLVKM